MVIIYIFVAFILIFLIYNSKLNEKIIEGNDGIDETKDCLGVYDINGYDECNKPCGGGVQEIPFNITQPPLDGYFQGNNEEAIQCPEPKERPCNTHNCPIHCEYVDGDEDEGWSVWTQDLDNNGKQIGTETRTRKILVNEEYNGTPCGKVTDSREHDVDCVQSAWSNWGACSKTCGGGTKTRTRSILQEKKNGGQICGPPSNTISCNTDNCPVDCVGDWELKGCLVSDRIKQYNVTRKSAYGGNSCAEPDKTVSLVAGACHKECVKKGWGGIGCKRHEWKPK